MTYVTQRIEALMGLFYLLTFYCAIRSFENPNSFKWRLASILICFTGMATKEVMVSAPLIILLYDRTFISGSFMEAIKKSRFLYLGLAGSWLLLGFLVGTGEQASANNLSQPSWTAFAYMLSQCKAILLYIKLTFWPRPLSIDYGIPASGSITDAIPALTGITLLLTGVIFALFKKRPEGFCGAWFFLILAPTSSVVPLLDTVVEHRMYLPLAGIWSLVVTAINYWGGKIILSLKLARQPQARAVGRLSLVFFAALLCFLTILRNEDYKSELVMWKDTVSKGSKSARAFNNLGNAICRIGRPRNAIPFYVEALRMKPDYFTAHSNLGVALAQTGQLEKGIEHLEEAIRLNRSYADAYSNLGLALALSGKKGEAVRHFKKALRFDPNNSAAKLNLNNLKLSASFRNEGPGLSGD